MSDRPRFDLSTVQVIASAGAAVTGAVLTSYLGDGGTILGTAVGSAASTTGFAVYKHYLGRTKEKVAPLIVEHARVLPAAGNTQPGRVGRWPGGPDENAATITNRNLAAGGRPAGSQDRGFPRTQQLRTWGPPTRTAPLAESPPGQTGAGRAPGEFGSVRVGDTTYVNPGRDGFPNGTGGHGAGGNGTGGHGGGDGNGNGGHGRHAGNGQPPWQGLLGLLHDRPRWVMVAASSAAVFVVVMIAITVIELGTGKPVSASVWGHQGSGTTIGGAVTGNQGSTSKTTPQPTGTPTPSTGTTTAPGQTQPSTSPSPSAVPSTSAPTTGPTTPASPKQSGAPVGGANQDNGATPAGQ